MTGRSMLRAMSAMLVGGVLTLVFAAPGAASPYNVTVLSQGGNAMPPLHLSLNNLGQVAGAWEPWPWPSNVPPSQWKYQPFFYDPKNGGKVTLPGLISPSGTDPGGYNPRYQGSEFYGLNNLGQTVTKTSDGVVLFDFRAGETRSISGPAGAITDSGVVVATQDTGLVNGWVNFMPVATQNGQVTNLGTPPGAVGALVQGANNVGQVLVEAAMTPGVFNHYFVLGRDGTWADLGVLNGNAINDHGVVAGDTGFVPGQPTHAALITPGVGATDLGTLSGDVYSTAYDVNNLGQAVGLSYKVNSSGDYRGFLYQNGTMTDLNTLIDIIGLRISSGIAINDQGQILARAQDETGSESALLLLTPSDLPIPPDAVYPAMPVPEPSTFLVFSGLTLAAGCVLRRRRG